MLVNPEHTSTRCPIHEEGVINYVDGRRGVHMDVVAVLNIRARALEALKAPYEGDV